MATCPGCGSGEQPDGARFCFSCGTPLPSATCASCQAEIVPGARFCSSCGAAQSGVPAARPAAAAAPVAARRITSVLFGDLVGFTTLSESRDQEDVRELLSRYFEECRQVITRYGGTVEKFIGDAVMAVWGVPTAHEDDAERAVRAGLELVNAVTALGVDVGIPELAMRVGIVTGEVAVTIGAEQQGMVAGDAVNTASRVQSVANPGQVWVDETTRLLTTSAITYIDAGSHQLKGKAEPVPLWSVRAVVAGVGGAQRADGLEAPHLGRDREVRLVKEIFHGVEETGRPALLVVAGEPGVGKSRLAWEFEKYVDGLSSPVRWHNGRCLAYGEGVAFYALAEAIRGRLQIGDDIDGVQDDTEDTPELLERSLKRFVPDPAEREWLEPRLGALLGIGSVGTFPREDLFAAWTAFLRRVGEDREPVVLVIDDAQHADDGLVAFVEHLLATATFPCFVALFTRPGLLEEQPALATNRRANVIHLEPLADADMEALLDGLVAGLPPAVRRTLVERAEGIPLYAVETVRSLIDRDLVVPRGGQYVLADAGSLDLAAIGAPASLQALIAARLDTLSAEERRVVDRASVLGNSFTRDELASLCPEVADLDGLIAGLVRAQIIRQDVNRFSSERGHYQFVQSVVRQVAYGSLSRRDRKAAHLDVVGPLEAADDAPSELSAIIAQHYLDALDAVPDDPDNEELTARAVEHLRRAAARARALGAPAEAAAHLQAAMDRTIDVRDRATVERDLADAEFDAGRYDDAMTHARSALTAFIELEDEVAAGAAASVLSAAMLSGPGDATAALAVAQEWYERLRDRDHDDSIQVRLKLARRMEGAMVRIPLNVRDIADERILLAERSGDAITATDSYVTLAIHYLNVGGHGLARLLFRAAAESARKYHRPAELVRALLNLNSDLNQDDAAEAAVCGREAVAVARTVGSMTWLSFAEVNLMLALLQTSDWSELPDLVGGAGREEPTNIPTWNYVEASIARARGQQWQPSWTVRDEPATDDPTGKAWVQLVESMAARDAGDPARAVMLGVDAVEKIHAITTIYDDFWVFWAETADACLAASDWDALARITAVLDHYHVNTQPNALRAHRHRIEAMAGIRRGAHPEEIEQGFRAALELFELWHADVPGARCAVDYAAWLSEQGRADEATPLLVAARAVFDRIGAIAWAPALQPAALA